MPGISFICDLKCDLRQKESRILQSLDSMLHMEQYESRILLKEESYFLGYTGYKEYPITSFENEEFCIYLEGQIYGKDYSAINSELNSLATYIFYNRDDVKEQVAEWLLNTDGDFIVFIFQKSSMRICIINDAISRLPAYYYKNNTDGKLVISRELRFVADLIDALSFDKMAIAQYLLFGYTLGRRTLWENISYLQPATLIRIDFNKPEIKFDVIRQVNFESKRYSNRNIKQNATELTSLFCEACKNRAKQSKISILSLSGGFDSRAVAAGLLKTGSPFQAVTMLSCNKEEALDVAIAEQLARELNFDWKLFELEPPRGRDVLRLLRIKNGLNYLAMSFILSFFDRLKETYGSNITYFTGDGGDRLKPHIKPPKTLKSLDKLINHILVHNQVFSLDDVAGITKIPRTKIMDELRNLVLSYPEREWNDKYIHFMVYESAFKWVFEGEDRNRCFFWSTNPFYSVKFFDYAMNIPDSMKSRYKLYGEFLTQLLPRASGIRTTHGNIPIRSIKARLFFFALDSYLRLSPNLRGIVRGIIKKQRLNEHNLNLIRCLSEQIKNNKLFSEYLSLDDVIQNYGSYSKGAILNLFTIVSMIEEFSCSASTIEKFYDTDFMTRSV
jgi:asparagine synthase (glutamine-hydrolysing)